MTRENKLALVVGFGLILLVGILVSDHFSPARLEAAAKIDATSPPGFAGRLNPPDRGSGTFEPPVVPVGLEDRGDRDERDRGWQPLPPPDDIEMGRQPQGDGSTRGPGAGGSDEGIRPVTRYTVRNGDSLARICRVHYGDSSLAAALAAANNLANPNSIIAGDVVLLPAESVLRGGRAAPASSRDSNRTGQPGSTGGTPANWTYVVKGGDALSRIVARHYPGRASDDVYRQIRRLNPELTSIDALREGQSLRMPPRS